VGRAAVDAKGGFVSDHIPDATKMVPDGYYTALVQCDTGGEISTHVRVLDGIPRNARGATLRRDACRDYMPVSVEDFCRAWPWDAAMELGALRTGNVALVERVKRLEEAITAGIALMRATDPFTLTPDCENDDGVSLRQMHADSRVNWDEPPTACEHIALHDAVLAFGRAVAEAKATP
jgi:hypothetical protein